MPEAAGDHHDLVSHLPFSERIDERSGIEVALPVIPQPPRSVRFRHGYPLLQRLRRVAVVKAGRVVDELSTSSGMRGPHHRVLDAAHRRQVAIMPFITRWG